MTGELIAALHSTGPWYLAVPAIGLALGLRFWRFRRGGRRGGPFGRGPFGRGPFGGGPGRGI